MEDVRKNHRVTVVVFVLCDKFEFGYHNMLSMSTCETSTSDVLVSSSPSFIGTICISSRICKHSC